MWRPPEPETRNPQEELNIRPPAPSSRRVTACRGVRLRALILALIGALAGATAAAKDKPPVQYQIPMPTPPDFSALDWLQGQWTGKTLPNSPPGDSATLRQPRPGKAFPGLSRRSFARGHAHRAGHQGIVDGNPQRQPRRGRIHSPRILQHRIHHALSIDGGRGRRFT